MHWNDAEAHNERNQESRACATLLAPGMEEWIDSRFACIVLVFCSSVPKEDLGHSPFAPINLRLSPVHTPHAYVYDLLTHWNYTSLT